MVGLIQIDGFGENRVDLYKCLSVLQLPKAVVAEPDLGRFFTI